MTVLEKLPNAMRAGSSKHEAGTELASIRVGVVHASTPLSVEDSPFSIPAPQT